MGPCATKVANPKATTLVNTIQTGSKAVKQVKIWNMLFFLAFFWKIMPLEKFVQNNPKWGAELVFPINQDPVDMLGRMDFDFDNCNFQEWL